MKPRVYQIAPGITATIELTQPASVLVPLAELQALRATVGELVALTEALEAGRAAPLVVRSAQGLARSVAARLGRL